MQPIDALTILAFQALGFSPLDTLYIVSHSEQAEALRVAKESYLATVKAIANQIIPAS